VLYTRDLRAARDEVANLNAELERRVADRTADLARVNEEIKRFAYIVTHDLRAPLVSIMGFTAEIEHGVKDLEALSGGGSDRAAVSAELAEAIAFVRSSTRRMDTLISAILKLSREGRRELRPEPVALTEVIESSVAAIQHQLSDASGSVTLAVDVPPMLSDRLSLEQIFGNLLDNAVKYRVKDRPLCIQIRASLGTDDRIVVEVADNGRGIAEEDREAVFELFRRSGPRDQPGEGLGLAYVRTIVRNLGGDITLKSRLGEGTTFRIVLPSTLVTPVASAA
jgi:signal transduction histidine kinase